MDLEILCSTTYKLEGDELEILLVHDALEGIRERGRRLGYEASDLPNAAAILRRDEPIVLGMDTNEYYDAPHHRWFQGKISAIRTSAWTISYIDGSSLVINDEQEVRRAIDH
eukprot:scaffold38057_cov41-Tisochrysis_lutea.AAC.1